MNLLYKLFFEHPTTPSTWYKSVFFNSLLEFLQLEKLVVKIKTVQLDSTFPKYTDDVRSQACDNKKNLLLKYTKTESSKICCALQQFVSQSNAKQRPPQTRKHPHLSRKEGAHVHESFSGLLNIILERS